MAYYQQRGDDNFTSRSSGPYNMTEDVDDMVDDTLVTLDTYHSDLNLIIKENRYEAEPLHQAGFAYMWAGAKATYGFKSGKICYEVKVVKHFNVILPNVEMKRHGVRLGWSVGDLSLQLGKDQQSYGYSDSGQLFVNGNVFDYGPELMENDVITCFLNFDSDSIELSFAKNGETLGVARSIPRDELRGKALFPHILTRNCALTVNFGQMEEHLVKFGRGYGDYIFAGNVEIEKRVRAIKGPAKKADCEAIMMIGLPHAGKSRWIENCIANNPHKFFNIIGKKSILGKMELKEEDVSVDFWHNLKECSQDCFHALLSIACKRRRNFIFDQTNVYPFARVRKMTPFNGFKRKAVVIIPSDEVYKFRCDKKCGIVPDDVILEMKANFVLPEIGDLFADVEYVGCSKIAAELLVKQYVREGIAANPQFARNRSNFRGGRSHRGMRRGVSSGSPMRRGVSSGSPMRRGVSSGSPMGRGVRSGSPMGRGVRSGSPMGRGVRSGSPMGRGVRSGSPMGRGVRSGSTMGRGVRSGSPMGRGGHSGSPLGCGDRRGPQRFLSGDGGGRLPWRASHSGGRGGSPRNTNSPFDCDGWR